MSLKDRISSPLEAGISVLDAHHLPPHLTPALEYVSNRLAKKSLHLTLVVIQRDYQLPSVVPPSPGLSTPITPTSPFGRLALKSSSSVSALKQLVTRGSSSTLSSPRSMEFNRTAISSPTPYSRPVPESPRFRWPLTPSTPLSPPPMTPSSSATDSNFSVGTSNFGIKLVHASQLCQRAEKILRSTLSKAESKFHIGSEWLSAATSPAACGLTSQLYNSSVIQNEVLFSSDGITLLALDRLYSLKSALSTYSRTRSPLRLEDAVDELRRIMLVNGGQRIPKADILRSYDWLSVTPSVVSDLENMYRRAYGGADGEGAISGVQSFRERMMMEPVIRDEDDESDDGMDYGLEYGLRYKFENLQPDTKEIDMAIAMFPSPKPPTPRGPTLKIMTKFAPPPVVVITDDPDEEEDGDRTARPTDQSPTLGRQLWTATSIDQVLSADVCSPASYMTRLGPMTPQVYDDISPVTRGEWGFLMGDDSLQIGQMASVETCS